MDVDHDWDLDEVTPNQALRALTASSTELAGVQVVRGTIGDLPFPWLLRAAQDMVRDGGHLVIAWDAKYSQLLLIGPDRAVYRFTTADPFTLPEPGPEPDATTGRPGLRLVRDPSQPRSA